MPGDAYYRAGKIQFMEKGVPVLQWASRDLRADRDLVRYLVWANPANLSFASPSVCSDPDVISAALNSPWYFADDLHKHDWKQETPPACACVLSNARSSMLAYDRVVLDAVIRSGYELEYADDRARANPTVVAWAGSPVGAAEYRNLTHTDVGVLESDFSMPYVNSHFEHLCMLSWTPSDYSMHYHGPECASWKWKNADADSKAAFCESLKSSSICRWPLFFRLAPSVRKMLWPDAYC